MPEDANQIEYFYSAHSAYAYLGAWELQRIANDTGWQVIHRPMELAPVMTAAGGSKISNRPKEHVRYFFGREMVRWAEWRDLPMMRQRPTYHDNPLALASSAIIASGDPGPLSRAILQAHWRDDADISDDKTLQRLADAVGQDGEALLAVAGSPEIEAQYKANTEEAIARHVFGSPTYFVRGDMFYGQDRLAMVERAITKPFTA